VAKVNIKEQSRKERTQLIEAINSKVSEINTIDLLSMLAMEFFMFPEDYVKLQYEITQACNEFVTGLASSKPNKKGRFPTPEDLTEINQVFQKVVLTYMPEYMPEKDDIKSYGIEDLAKVG
jgi:hypothetical protein